MDWSLLGLSFSAVFLSELGDKSQIAAIALGSSPKFPQAVFLGTASALLLSSFLGVLIGHGTSQLLPPAMIKTIAATGFLIMGTRLIWLAVHSERTSSIVSPPTATLVLLNPSSSDGVAPSEEK